jgi:hypothetical protein
VRLRRLASPAPPGRGVRKCSCGERSLEAGSETGLPAEAPGRLTTEATVVRNESTAIIEREGDWFIAYCPEIPGANGQGRTQEEAKQSLAEAIELILEDRSA